MASDEVRDTIKEIDAKREDTLAARLSQEWLEWRCGYCDVILQGEGRRIAVLRKHIKSR